MVKVNYQRGTAEQCQQLLQQPRDQKHLQGWQGWAHGPSLQQLTLIVA
jgi:hypothetical protein